MKKNIFQNCLSLERVYVPRASQISVFKKFGDNLSPGFEREIYRP